MGIQLNEVVSAKLLYRIWINKIIGPTFHYSYKIYIFFFYKITILKCKIQSKFWINFNGQTCQQQCLRLKTNQIFLLIHPFPCCSSWCCRWGRKPGWPKPGREASGRRPEGWLRGRRRSLLRCCPTEAGSRRKPEIFFDLNHLRQIEIVRNYQTVTLYKIVN